MADRSETDPRLDEIQDRVDAIRNRLPDNPGMAVIDDDDVPAYFEDDAPEGVISHEEAVRRADGEHHQGHAPG